MTCLFMRLRFSLGLVFISHIKKQQTYPPQF